MRQVAMDLKNFEKITSGTSSYFRCTGFARVPGLRHGFSTRDVEGDASFVEHVGLDPGRLVTPSQFHSDRFHIIVESQPRTEPPLRGDALISAGRPVAVRVADCFPILVADPARLCVASVHAGWRGTLSRILAKTIRGMSDAFGSDPSSLLFAFGPAIRSCCFEVGPEVADAFALEYPGVQLSRPHPARPNKILLDLRQALNAQLDEIGVTSANVFDLDACTACRTDLFFSYRREREQSGRMMAVIGITST